MLRAPVPVLQLSKLLGRVAHFSGVWVVCMRAVGGGGTKAKKADALGLTVYQRC